MIFGKHEPGFAPLAHALEEIVTRRPYGGAALTLYLEGVPVFDMWGGARDNQENPWQEHTTSVAFSATKGVTSTALHIAADRGLLHYDEPVARYWPEFAAHGKGGITIRHVLSHAAGLFDAARIFQHADDMLDWDKATHALAQAVPQHEPGRFHAYHALTYGHLVGEIVRRVSGRPFSEFVRDEIATPLRLSDFHVGAPEEALTRAARTYQRPRKGPPISKDKLKSRYRARSARMHRIARVARLLGVPMKPERIRDAFATRGIATWDFASPSVLRACLPAVGGLFSARDLARMYAALALGGTLDGARILSASTLRAATEIQTHKLDGVMLLPMRWRLGYHAVFSKFGPVRGAFGHFGYNGSGAWASPRHNAALGFVVNAGLGNPLGDLRLVKLTSAALFCIRKQR